MEHVTNNIKFWASLLKLDFFRSTALMTYLMFQELTWNTVDPDDSGAAILVKGDEVNENSKKT